MSSATKPVEQKARELLTCPFCGRKPKTMPGRLGAVHARVWCPGSYSECRPSPTSEADTLDEAINNWNTRAALNTDEERIRREAFEEAAKVANEIGGRYPGELIAERIRSLSTPSKGVG